MAVQRDKVIASAEKLVAKGKIEPAIKEYERLLDDNPNDVNTLNRIGDLWVRINRNDEAVKTFGKIAEHYARDGFFLKAIAIYKKINKLDPSKLDIYARLADLYAKQGLAMEAKSQYQVLADYYLKHGDPNNALATYRKISELDPNSINVHVKLADLHSQVGHTAEALKEYDRVGRMLLKRGMLDEAVQVFRKALKIDAKNVDLVESLVVALVEAKDLNNAQAIIEQALQANPEHPRLLALWGKVLLSKGDQASAMKALQRGLAADESDPVVREALADLYLRQSNADSALEMIVPLVERAVSRGERGTAVEMLQRVLRVDQGHTPTLERLVALYTRLNEETNILSSMNSLAEAHVSRGEHEQAAAVLERLIQREPQNAQHRTKLQFVRSHLGTPSAPATPPPPPRPRTVETPLTMEVSEPEPTFDETPSISLDDTGPSIEFDFNSEEAAAPSRIVPAVELAAMETDLDTGEDLDFITEHLTEAEVFAKYGLAEKAIEHLRAVIDRSPKHGPAYDRLFRVQLDEGDIEGARATATEYISLLEGRGDSTGVEAVRNEFLSRGNSLTTPARKSAPPAPAPEPAAEEDLLASGFVQEQELSIDLDSADDSVEIEMELEEPALEPEIELETLEEEPVALETFAPEVAVEEPAAEQFVAEEPAVEEFVAEEPAVEELPQLEFGVDAETEIELEPTAEIADLDFGAAPVEPEPQVDFAAEQEPALAFDDVETSAPEPFFGTEAIGGFASEPTQEELAEIDFYVEQELFDEARTRLDHLDSAHPGNRDVAERRARLEAAQAAAIAPPVQPQAAPAPPPSRPAMLSREEIESELLAALPADDEDIVPAPPPPPPTAPPPPPVAATAVQEENLFADEDDFFDLAAELESELESEEVVSLSEEEQSLEEIFKEFKRGVEQQLDSEDYDTHYNLGIAYKEMGLIDEAIGEFQLASKDPKRAVECASMLGLCFLEKGMPQLAIKWYRKGLEMPEITEEEHIGLLYDLGSAHVEVGDTESAQKAFMEVYGINSNYRDVVGRIKQLEDARN